MKVEILRNPGLDLGHDLAARGGDPVEIPKDLTEGEVRELPDDVAEALISVNVARKADKGAEVTPAKPTPTATPAKGHATPPAKDHPPAKN